MLAQRLFERSHRLHSNTVRRRVVAALRPDQYHIVQHCLGESRKPFNPSTLLLACVRRGGARVESCRRRRVCHRYSVPCDGGVPRSHNESAGCICKQFSDRDCVRYICLHRGLRYTDDCNVAVQPRGDAEHLEFHPAVLCCQRVGRQRGWLRRNHRVPDGGVLTEPFWICRPQQQRHRLRGRGPSYGGPYSSDISLNGCPASVHNVHCIRSDQRSNRRFLYAAVRWRCDRMDASG
mmetsp:Transcript_19415/g.50485  ORF Transcript_19415/g.50485 Transcript_19415/m.50485 type:complete len:235 (+) Transcript_19415:98-802(+)